jgi:hypothetical protein
MVVGGQSLHRRMTAGGHERHAPAESMTKRPMNSDVDRSCHAGPTWDATLADFEMRLRHQGVTLIVFLKAE